MSERARDARPTCPISLVSLAVLLITLRLVLRSPLEAPRTFFEEAGFWRIAAILGFCAGGFLLCHRRRRSRPSRSSAMRRTVLLIAVVECCLLGLALGRAEIERMASSLASLSNTAVSGWELTISRQSSPTERGWWSAADVAIDGVRAGKVWISSQDPLERGERLRAVGRFKPPAADEWSLSSQMQGITGTASVVSILGVDQPSGLQALVNAARNRLLEAVDPTASEGRALVAAASLGYKEGIGLFGIDDLFSAVGLSHLVAVSGLHVSLVLAGAGAILTRVRWTLGARVACLLAVGLVYVALADAPTSAMRSFAMVGASQCALLAGRRAWSLNALGIAGIAMLLMAPTAAGDIGFCLSVLCVAAIALVAPWIRRTLALGERSAIALRKLLRRSLSAFREAILTQAALAVLCTTVSAPLVAAAFGAVSLMAPLASIVLVLPFEAFLALALGSVFLGWIPGVGPCLVEVAARLADCLLIVIRAFSEAPFVEATLSVGEPWATVLPWMLVFGFWLWWPETSLGSVVLLGGLGAATLACALLTRPFLLGPRIVILDVGQGDAILVQDGAHAVLVDTGPGEEVAEALERQGVLSLDAVILTHQHDDHSGGVPSLVGRVRVGSLVVPEGQLEALGDETRAAVLALGSPVEELSVGDRMSVGGFTLTMLWPEEPEDGDENDESLVLELTRDEGTSTFRALLTGDAEGDVLHALDERGELGDLDLLKVGHHGSAASIDEELARTCAAEVAVASAGEGNRYGHPTDECVEALESAGTLFLCTKDVGDVSVSPGQRGPRVSCASSP